MPDTTTARRALYLALMTDGIAGHGHSPDRSEQVTALIEAFRDEVLAKFAQGDAREILVRHRDQVLTEAGGLMRMKRHHINDCTDPAGEAAALLYAARTTSSQDRPCGCSARFTRHADGCPTLTAASTALEG